MIAEDLTSDVAEFNSVVVETLRNLDGAELMKRFCDIMHHYLDVKQ